MTAKGRLPSSWRDPSGFLFTRDGILCRQVNQSYREHYDQLLDSGLYQKLVADGLLIAHKDADIGLAQTDSAYKIIQPEMVPFVSYPYEWCFSQLKHAALLTLHVQQLALEHGLSLKDASAYNVQFVANKPVLIDTLSFEKYREGDPWVAYRQFCQHFLAPLALMSHTDVRLSQLLRVYIDGIPLDLASSLLARRTHLKFSILTHIHLHARSQKRYASHTSRATSRRMSRRALLGLIDNLNSAVSKLKWRFPRTEWGDYYDMTNYSEAGFQRKQELLGQYLEEIRPERVWDLGANTGVFSRIAAKLGSFAVAFDIDEAAVEQNYRECRRDPEPKILPLLLDLTNPSPALGWANRERESLAQRGPAGTIIALALIHHLAISNNLPLDMVAGWIALLAEHLIIEFVPKSDSQVQRLLATREDVFSDYNQEAFEAAFADKFELARQDKIDETERTLYLMHRKQD